MTYDFTEKFYQGQRIFDQQGTAYKFNKSFMFDTGVGFDLVAECINEETGLKFDISETLLTSVPPLNPIPNSPEGRVLSSLVEMIAGIYQQGDSKVVISPENILSYVDNRLSEEGLTRNITKN